ncbi:MAG TPA: hypothetical protein V6C89_20320 [Drouetiella sp.]|jgi:hypothetical protein
MSDRLTGRADDRAVSTDRNGGMEPLVSMSDMRAYQNAMRAPQRQTDVTGVSAAPTTVDFGSPEALYGAASPGNGNARRVRNGAESQAPQPGTDSGARSENTPEVPGEIQPARPVTEQDLSNQRAALTREIARMPAAMARDISESMRVFENRRPALTNEQIAGVYEATQRLLEDSNRTSPLTLQQRQLLATGIMDNAARPSDIDQGNHETCNVTTLEERLYTRNPERAAAITAEVGLTGGFTGRNGFRATLDRASLRPDSEATVLPSRGDGLRNYASQIFDVAVLNDFYQRANPNVRFVQRDPRTAADPRHMTRTGEGILTSDNDQVTPEAARRARTFPGLNLTRINRLGENLGLEPNYVIGHVRADDARVEDGTTVVRNVQELGQALERARATNNFPLVVGVEVDGPMFRGIRGRGAHVLSIVGYNPETQTVQISNQWGRAQDLQNVRLQDLHDSMFVRRQNH